ncbi:PAS domain S-box protein [Kamptonema formosum]|uniref:PAS domain S-box protein n=1 Tax=Kamptonema formosum TaxID=331992 RepID=UPI0003635DF6|nr:PAS domain S-box protein [Oscillatoria sp. PCC 10802]
MKLKTKLVSSFLAVASLAAILGILKIEAGKNVKESFSAVSGEITPKLLALQQIKMASFKMMVEANSYALLQGGAGKISGDVKVEEDKEEELESFEAAREDLEKELENFKSLADAPEERKFVQEIEAAKKDFYQAGQTLIQVKAEGGRGPKLVGNKRSLEQAENYFTEVIDRAIEAEIEQLERENEVVASRAGMAIAINAFSVAAVALISGALALILAEKIAKPILEITEAAVKIGRGDLGARVDVETESEIGVLAEAFNQMAESLNKTTVSKGYVDNIIKSMLDALFVLNRDGTIKTFNLAAFLMLRYPEEIDLLGKHVKILFAEEKFLKELDFEESKRNSFLGRKETTLLAKDGQTVPVYFSVSVMRDERGEIEGFVCLAQDITERKAAEAAREESEAKWRSLVENAPDIILTADAAGRIKFLNRVTPGLSARQVIGSSLYDWVPPDCRLPFREIVESVFTTGIAQQLDLAGFGPYSSTSWYSSRISPIQKNGEVVAVTIIATEIAERKRMEEALRESEKRYQLAVRAGKVGVWDWNVGTGEIYLDSNLKAMLGFEPEEIPNRIQDWLKRVHPEDRSAVMAAAKAHLEGRTPDYEIEHRTINKDGSIRWILARGTAIRDGGGKAYRMMGTDSDITEGKQGEDALLQAKQDLEIRVQERTTELTQLLEQLQRESFERQLVAEALSQSQDRLNSILNSLDDVVWSVHATTFEMLYISPAAETVYGLPQSEFFNHPNLWMEMIHPQDRQRVEGMLQKRITAGTTDMEYRIVRPSGEVHWLRSRSRLVCDATGSPVRIDGIETDITERKRAEAALRQSETQFRKQAKREALLNRLASQIRNSLNLDTILETAVQEIHTLLQIDRCLFVWYRPNGLESWKAGSAETWKGLESSDRPSNRRSSKPCNSYWEVVKEAKKPNAPSLLGAYPDQRDCPVIAKLLNREMIRLDDVRKLAEPELQQLQWVSGFSSIAILPIHTPAGEIGLLACGQCCGSRPWRDSEVGLLAAIADQLAIAISQAELYAGATEAARAAKEQAQQLQGAMSALQQTQAQLIQTEKMSSLGQMVAGVAHEINNPVSFIYGNVDPAMQYIQDLLGLIDLYQEHSPSSPEIEEEIDAIDLEFVKEDLPKLLYSMKVGAERIRQIVLSLRNFSRLDEAQMKAVDLHEGIDSTLLILQNRLKGKGASAEIKVLKEYGELPQVDCFAGQMNQVFMNILANAIDALEEPRTGAAGAAGGREAAIRIRTGTPDSNRVEIRIADSGPGIKPEVRSRVFDPFFTTKPVGAGTGLGLSISYQIVVEKHGGQLKCYSEPGKGTEFVIELPVRQNYSEPPIFKE